MRLPSYPWRFAHLAALWGYGVSQPIFSMLKGNPEFLVINGASRAEAVAFAALLAFGPPIVVVGIELACGLLSTKISGVVHVLAVWAFGFAALVQVLSRFDPTSAGTNTGLRKPSTRRRSRSRTSIWQRSHPMSETSISSGFSRDCRGTF